MLNIQLPNVSWVNLSAVRTNIHMWNVHVVQYLSWLVGSWRCWRWVAAILVQFSFRNLCRFGVWPLRFARLARQYHTLMPVYTEELPHTVVTGLQRYRERLPLGLPPTHFARFIHDLPGNLIRAPHPKNSDCASVCL